MLRPQTAIEKYLRHPLEAMGAMLIWGIFKILPVDQASALGGWLARSVGPWLRLSDRARDNIRRAFPEAGDAAVERILIDTWDNLGRTVGEFPHLGAFSFTGKNPRIRIDGLEHLKHFRDDDAPGFYLSAHLGNWELAPLTAYLLNVPSAFVYREANNRSVQKLYLIGRGQYRDMMIPKGSEGAKQIIKALRDGKHIGIMADQKMNNGIAVPFFGEDVMTAPALAQMALRFKCPVIGARVIREGGAYFRIEVTAPMFAEDTGNKHEDVARFMAQTNAIIEGWIRENPGQWLWLHNRWPGKQ
ncbi:MAG: lauroyl acyltransferase [Rhodospirillales bacterium]|jgi:Kdo2-lipid IVA lauroyltransferase/acyltransferase|nr:lauroyl acyltransferase [Rhodospirillales bacterium]